MLEQVKETIHKYEMIQSGDRVLVGVSGGPDSVALLHVLKELSEHLKFEVFVAHLDHRFRGQESADDAQYVRELAASMKIEAVVEGRDVARYALEKKLSAETAAREVRYCFFQYAAEKFGCNKLATGHNANDQAETVLFNLLRGSGLAGLGGIPPVRDGWIIRPLIEITRSRIEKYCRENDLKTRLDKSNLKSIYTRNKIRLNLLPLLEKEYNHNLVETLARTSEIFREEDQFIENIALNETDKVFLQKTESKVELSLDNISVLPGVLQKRILRRAWSLISGHPNNLEFIHTEKALHLIARGHTGAVIELPHGIILTRGYDRITFSNQKLNQEKEYFYELNIPGFTEIPEIDAVIQAEFVNGTGKKITAGTHEIYLDYDLITKPIAARNRKPGDIFKPIGMEGTKKIKNLFIDSKVSRDKRWKIPLIISGDDKVIWIAGLRGDRRWQATNQTKNILKLKLIVSDHE